jgi:hypothetical protein
MSVSFLFKALLFVAAACLVALPASAVDRSTRHTGTSRLHHVLSAGADVTANPCKTWRQDPDIDYAPDTGATGVDIGTPQTAKDANACQALCAKDAKCFKFSFSGGKCTLKTVKFSFRKAAPGVTSGFCADGAWKGLNLFMIVFVLYDFLQMFMLLCSVNAWHGLFFALLLCVW